MIRLTTGPRPLSHIIPEEKGGPLAGKSEEDRSIIELPTVHRAYLAEKTYGTTDVRCGLCARRCEIADGDRGFCGTRVNIDRELYTLTYGDLLACESRPVEVKPFFHFHPGTTMTTIAGPSCNLRCPWCQNHELSRALPRPLKARHVPMSEVIDSALASGDSGICVSFSEPTMLFEYTLGLLREASARGLASAYVSNGYMTGEAVHMLARAGLQAMNVDVKGSESVYRDYCGAEQGDSPPWETVRNALEMGLHVEVVHLVVTGLNDSKEAFASICEKHLEFAGRDTPLHITRYHPAFEYEEPATPMDFMEWAYGAAMQAGIRFPYLGNVPEHRMESTLCPSCGDTLLERSGARLLEDRTDAGACPGCGYALPIVK